MPQYLALIDPKLLELFEFQESRLFRGNQERHYYLLRSDPHVRLTSWHQPLENIIGERRVVLLGQEVIDGGLTGNKHLTGERGVTLSITDFKPRLKTQTIDKLSDLSLIRRKNEQRENY